MTDDRQSFVTLVWGGDDLAMVSWFVGPMNVVSAEAVVRKAIGNPETSIDPGPDVDHIHIRRGTDCMGDPDRIWLSSPDTVEEALTELLGEPDGVS